ncbi:MAG: GHKL domain-containing protein, partial [Bacteroidales bacterium]|nr:GHKL domain-containing protein [Bacteroidales bacterium]
NTSILSDSILLTDIIKSQFSDSVEIIACEKIKSKFSDTFWSKYNILVTICYNDKILNVQPENYLINCKDYFNDIIDDFGKLTTTDNLYFLDINSEESNYIVSYFFAGNQNFNIDSVFLFIELSSKFIPEGLGYPELLIDKEANINPNLSNYSYAKYKNDELIYKFGNYYYSLKLSNYHNKYDSIPQSFIRNGFNHTHYKIDSSTDLILSNKSETFLDIIAPFSYLLIFYSIYLFIFLAIIYLPFNRYRIELNFRNRLQFSIVSIILFSFIIIGFSTLLYIIKLNNDKNHTILSEKAHSILIELEHKLADEESLTPDMHEYLSKLLNKFSLVFFSDINLYDLNGNLIASSRPKIFDEGLVSDKINTIAFRHLVINKKLLFIQNEKIGNHDYLSAYVPFLNEQNKLIAYLNLPYFAKQTELKNEISTFLTAFINIYVLLFAIAIFIAIVISRYITKPLKLLENKISKLQLGKLNEKIEWIRKDEIGSLVIEYNRMIDELANSAELLAKSERESAWREMAKQVAHEIKNPLTPMKLSVQYLKKAWDEKVSDWEQRLNRFSQTIIEQIDSLSTIASEFSDFAKMPQTKNEKIELSKIIRSSINLFKDVKFVDINFEAGKDKKYFVFADEKQILRVFNNLIKNSIQAISSTDGGKIDISINPENGFYIIKIADNGSGIPKEQADKIFFPSFTTKSGGMGLGLAIVKSIVIDAGGKIWFESQEGKGTTFKIKLPVYI